MKHEQAFFKINLRYTRTYGTDEDAPELSQRILAVLPFLNDYAYEVMDHRDPRCLNRSYDSAALIHDAYVELSEILARKYPSAKTPAGETMEEVYAAHVKHGPFRRP